VERLRIELAGKCFDLLLVDDVGSARKALPDVEIIEIELIVAEFLSDSVNLGSNQGPPATNRPDIVSYFTFPREPALLTPFRNPVNDSRCLVVARREAAGKRAPTPPVIFG
jgi:hypothetical protein